MDGKSKETPEERNVTSAERGKSELERLGSHVNLQRHITANYEQNGVHRCQNASPSGGGMKSADPYLALPWTTPLGDFRVPSLYTHTFDLLAKLLKSSTLCK